jgi:hypothetical protein
MPEHFAQDPLAPLAVFILASDFEVVAQQLGHGQVSRGLAGRN